MWIIQGDVSLKKKVIGLAVVASLMLTGVVSAASMWGSYKGNDIIRITSNGSPVKTSDVPAISYNGRTMVPINMLAQLGIGYNWDQKNKTLDVIVNNTAIEPSELNSSDILIIKGFIKTANFFNKLESLGDMITDLSNTYSLAFQEMNSDNINTYFKTANTHLDGVIDSYNSIIGDSKNYSDNTIQGILNDYYAAIDYYKNVDTYLNKYFYSKLDSDFDNYLDNSKNGFNISFNAKKRALSGYNKYISLAVNN